jgi:hypothetical protein
MVLRGSRVQGIRECELLQLLGIGGSYTIGAAVFCATWWNVRFANIAAVRNTTVDFNDADVRQRKKRQR